GIAIGFVSFGVRSSTICPTLLRGVLDRINDHAVAGWLAAAAMWAGVGLSRQSLVRALCNPSDNQGWMDGRRGCPGALHQTDRKFHHDLPLRASLGNVLRKILDQLRPSSCPRGLSARLPVREQPSES